MANKVSVKKLLEIIEKYDFFDCDDIFVGNGSINMMSLDEKHMWEISYGTWGLYFDENGFLEEDDEDDVNYDHVSICHMVRNEKDNCYYCQDLFEEAIE